MEFFCGNQLIKVYLLINSLWLSFTLFHIGSNLDSVNFRSHKVARNQLVKINFWWNLEKFLNFFSRIKITSFSHGFFHQHRRHPHFLLCCSLAPPLARFILIRAIKWSQHGAFFHLKAKVDRHIRKKPSQTNFWLRKNFTRDKTHKKPEPWTTLTTIPTLKVRSRLLALKKLRKFKI